MTEARRPCETFGPDATALARGVLDPAEEAAVRAHLATCPDCAALAEDAARLFAAAAARPSPAPDAARRARLLAALDAEQAREAARGPVLRLLDAAGRRYEESRAVRFFTISVAVHAAAALLLAAWLRVEGGAGPRREGTVDVATVDPLPPVYPEERPDAPEPKALRVPAFAEDFAWPIPGAALSEPRLVPPAGDLLDLDAAAAPRLYPGGFAEFARGRFLGPRREERMARAFGPEGGPAAALSAERGLRWLSGMQEADGTWPAPDRFRGGVTANVLMAYQADGRTAMRPGPWQDAARNAVTVLVRSQDPGTGLLGGFARGAADDRPLCNHGPALEALAEAYGLDYGRLPEAVREELRRVIDRGVAAAVRAQLADGSFGYAPGARAGDSSVTLLQVRGLEAARRAGFEVDAEALRRAGAWIAARVGPDGRLGYREAGDRARDATLTAEALPLAAALGLPADVRDRMRAVVLEEARSDRLGDRVLFRTAALEAMAAAPGEEPRAAASSLARATLGTQRPGGVFLSGGDPYARAAGDSLSTALSVRALTAPYRPSSW